MLRELLQVRRGESTRAFLLFIYLFLVIASSVVTKNTRDPIFQHTFGNNMLPYADMTSALFVAAVMGLYLRASRRAGLKALLIGTLLVSSAATVMFWFVARVREPVWMLPVLYVWASVAAVLLPAQVWTLANHVMTTREAKRLFGIVSGGAISGGIAGGLVTRAIATRSAVADLLLPSAVALAVCPFLVAAIWRERTVNSSDPQDDRVQDHRSGVREGFALIWQSPHLRSVAALICVSSLVTSIVGLQFKAIAYNTYKPDLEHLAAFYGLFDTVAGALSLGIQLLVAPRLLRRYGLGVALLVVPVALTGGSFALLLSGGLWAASLLRGSDKVVRYSIDKSTVELLYLPVPVRQMARAKALIDTVVVRVGDGLGALLVTVAWSLVGLTAVRTSVVTLVLLSGWLVAAVAASRHYGQSLRASIYEHRLDAERLAQAPERETREVLAHTLDSGEPDEIMYALTLLQDHDPPISHGSVGALLKHPSAAVRRKAIAVLAAADESAATLVEPLLHDADRDVRAEALVYLAQCGHLDPLAHLTDLDNVHGSAVASAVAHFLARPGPAQNMDAVRVLLDAATSGDGSDRHLARMEAARLIGSLPDQFEEQLNSLLKDRSVDVARLALRAAAAVGKPASVPLIIGRLGDPELAADTVDALVAFGDRAIPALRDTLANQSLAIAVRHAIPDVLQRMATQEADQLLVEYLLDTDPVLRLKSVSALNKLRQQTGNRGLELELVETVLAAEILGHYRSYQLLGRISTGEANSEAARAHIKATMDQELERIFRLMKLLLPEHDLHSAYFGLQSGNAVVHANALEFLEHALPARFRALLLPLIDSEVSLQARITIADRMVGTTLETSEQALAAFAASDLLRDAAREAERQLGHPGIGSRPADSSD